MSIAACASVLALPDRVPEIASDAFVAEGARIVGAVSLGAGASVWYNAVLRADSAAIVIGAGSNIQDNVSVHVDAEHPVHVGRDVSVGHNAVVHGCRVGDGSLIGMGAVILSGADIGSGCLVAAGAVVLGGTIVPDGSLVAGTPARVRRELTAAERANLAANAVLYRGHVETHARARAGASGPGTDRGRHH